MLRGGEMVTDQFDAERIVDAQRAGAVPPLGLSELCIGREDWLESVRHDLNFVSRGASKVRLVSAPWGGGKTHFLLMVKEEAIKMGFAVSHIELHSREAPFDRFEIVFPRLIRDVIFPRGDNLESVLDNWASSFPFYSAEDIARELRKVSPSLDFRAALRACLLHANGDLVTHRSILRDVAGWLGGDNLSLDLKRYGVYNPLKITNVGEMVGAFLKFIVQQGYKGMVVMLDEAEAITSLTQSKKRNEANQNIRKLLDNADENIGLYVMFATTPTFLNDPKRGARSYPALWSRIQNVFTPEMESVNTRSTIIPLKPLDENQFRVLAKKIMNIHSAAYSWQADNYISGQSVDVMIAKVTKQPEVLTIRMFIRTLVNLLDQVEHTKKANLFENLVVSLNIRNLTEVE